MISLKIVFLAVLILISVFSIVKIFVGKKVIMVNSELGTCELIIEKSGFYSLWVKGKLFKRTGLDNRNVKILDAQNKTKRSFVSLLKPKVNGVSHGILMLKYYYLPVGVYQFQVGEGKESSLFVLDNLLMLALPSKQKAEHTYLLKNTYPEFVLFFAMMAIGFSSINLVELLK